MYYIETNQNNNNKKWEIISLLLKNYNKFSKKEVAEFIEFAIKTNKKEKSLTNHFSNRKINTFEKIHYQNFDNANNMTLHQKCYLYSQSKNIGVINKKIKEEFIYGCFSIEYYYKSKIKKYIEIYIIFYRLVLKIYNDVINEYSYFTDKISLLIILKFENEEGDILSSRLADRDNTFFLVKHLSIKKLFDSIFKLIINFLEQYRPKYIIEITIYVETNIIYD